MKIRRFYENEVQGPEGKIDLMNDISSERVEEIIKDLSEQVASLDEFVKTNQKFESEFEKYRSKSKKGNDQIDDSVINLQRIIKSLEDAKSSVDTLVTGLEDYIKSGRKYIYKEG